MYIFLFAFSLPVSGCNSQYIFLNLFHDYHRLNRVFTDATRVLPAKGVTLAGCGLCGFLVMTLTGDGLSVAFCPWQRALPVSPGAPRTWEPSSLQSALSRAEETQRLELAT